MATHSIFGASAPPGTIGSYTDAGSTSVLMNQFYIVGAPTRVGWTIEAVKIWIPAGSVLIGRTGSVGLIRSPGALFTVSQSVSNDFYTNGAYKAFTTPLVAGWNQHPLNGGPYTIANGDGILVGYNLGGGYLFSSDITAVDIPSATAANLYFSQYGTSGSEPSRSRYADSSGISLGHTTSRSYGIDIVVNDNVGGSSGVGSASDDIQFTDTAVGVRKPLGNASDDIQFSDLAAGVRKPVGSASDDIQFSDTAAGVSPTVGMKYGSASDDIQFSDTASGFAPAVGGATGSALSTLTLDDTAQGRRSPVGAVLSTLEFSDTAQGRRAARGGVVSTIQFSDTAGGGEPVQLVRTVYRRSRHNGSWTAWVAD